MVGGAVEVSNIRGECARLGLTQRELAVRLGVGEKTVSSWETGQSQPTVHDVLRMSELFDCTTDWLLGRDEERRK